MLLFKAVQTLGEGADKERQLAVCACSDEDAYLVEQTGAKNDIKSPQAKKVLRLMRNDKSKDKREKQTPEIRHD